MICEFCEGLGWLHAVGLNGGREHIERCDECDMFGGDEAAANHHATLNCCKATFSLA